MEEIVSIKNKDGERIWGILHVPDEGMALKKRVAVNLLNPGLKNRVAPNRLNVKLARKLCSMGCFVLRFDPLGVGDSEGDLSSTNETSMALWAIIQRGHFVEDTLKGNDFLASKVEPDELVLIGQCGGGVTAALSGARDKRVDGLILIDMPFRLISPDSDESQALLKSYTKGQMMAEGLRDFLRMHWLGKLLRKDSRRDWVRGIIEKSTRLIARRVEGRGTGCGDDPGVNWNLMNSLTDFMDRGKDVFFVFAENDFSLREYKSHFANPRHQIGGKGDAKYSIRVIKNANHIYAETEWQDSLFGNIIEWFHMRETIRGNTGVRKLV